jgi:formylglycine-generating enzyme required for sulfatase activity
VRVEKGKDQSVELRPEPVPAGLEVRASDQDGNAVKATVKVDGEKVGTTPGRFEVSACASKVEVKREGYASYEATLSLEAREMTKVRAKMPKRTAGQKGYVKIPAGTFQMGSPTSESGHDDDETRNKVTITQPYLMKKTEVTQGEWEALMGTNPSRFQDCGADCPVDRVNWYEAVTYLNRLSEKEGLEACYETSGCSGTLGGGCSSDETNGNYCTGDYRCEEVEFEGLSCRGYRLPTEAEWEYAARGGTDKATYAGNLTIRGKRNAPVLDEIAVYGGNSKKTYRGDGIVCEGWAEKQYEARVCGPAPVKTKEPNAYGLYDMIGNVWEWTNVWYGPYEEGHQKNPTGPATGSIRVFRGCGWRSEARYCRAALRNRFSPAVRLSSLGFRPARSVSP